MKLLVIVHIPKSIHLTSFIITLSINKILVKQLRLICHLSIIGCHGSLFDRAIIVSSMTGSSNKIYSIYCQSDLHVSRFIIRIQF